MNARHFWWRPGALVSLQLRKISGTSVKSFHEMKGDRDGKSAKRSATRNCKNQQKGVQQETAYSAVVVNDHMYPRPYIVFDPKGVI